jgi:hypothetical protein
MTVYNQYNSPGLWARFWEKVVEDGDCWRWTGTVSIGGRYGAVRVDGKMQAAHRIAYRLIVGAIEPRLELDHLCRNTWCVRPEHLEPVTHRENVRRGAWGTRAFDCPKGHGQKVDRPSGRVCRACVREQNRAYRARLRAAA